MKVLFIGDIDAKPGRQATAALLPDIRKHYACDLVIANVENVSHGKGVTKKALDDIRAAGVDVFTSGNHVWDKPEVFEIFDDPNYTLLRPANYPDGTTGSGAKIIPVGNQRLLLINLQGRVFMHEQLDDPFQTLEKLIKQHEKDAPDAIVVDFHAEVTSEKRAFGFFADGKVSAVVGTHTHVPTADAQILPKGTAYVTDLGMVGPKHAVLGVDKEIIMRQFLTQLPQRFETSEDPLQIFCSVLIEIDTATKLAKHIERVDREVKL
ncbi:MAG: TIGR00282 family metallophosphoesterase [Parcubacteria group bacterium]